MYKYKNSQKYIYCAQNYHLEYYSHKQIQNI